MNHADKWKQMKNAVKRKQKKQKKQKQLADQWLINIKKLSIERLLAEQAELEAQPKGSIDEQWLINFKRIEIKRLKEEQAKIEEDEERQRQHDQKVLED